MKQSVFAVIAAKNEEKHIYEVVKDTRKYVDMVIVVDDGSVDNTKGQAKKAGAVVLEHMVNLGKGAAIITGCEFALDKKAKSIILLDADGQHEPKEIPHFLEELKKNEIVFGMRTIRKSMPSVYKFGNWVIHKLTQLLFGMDIPDTQCGYRAFRTDIFKKIRWQSSGYSMESEMIANVGKKRLKYSMIKIGTIYSDKYKGTTVKDGILIVANLIWWRISR